MSLAFSSKKKKKRNWRDELKDKVDEPEDEEEYDHEAMIREYAKIEKEEAAIQAKKDKEAKGKADEEARKRAACEEERAKKEAKEHAAKKRRTDRPGSRHEAARPPRPHDEGIDPDAYQQRRVIVVTNLAHHTTSDDVKLLFEGFGKLAGINFQPGRAVLEFRDTFAANDCMPIKGSKIQGLTVLHSRRLQMEWRLDPTKALPGGGGRGSRHMKSNYGTIQTGNNAHMYDDKRNKQAESGQRRDRTGGRGYHSSRRVGGQWTGGKYGGSGSV